jgi:hypothetical protein
MKIIFIVLILFFCVGNTGFGFDLAEEITATFQKYYNL